METIVCKEQPTDISGMENINEICDASLTKKWIKLIPIQKTVLFEEKNILFQ
jgi:hypothetical protein